jgi:hypothetical protein
MVCFALKFAAWHSPEHRQQRRKPEMTNGDSDSIVEVLRRVRTAQEDLSREIRELHTAQASHTTLIRALCDELVHLRADLARESTGSWTMTRDTATPHEHGRAPRAQIRRIGHPAGSRLPEDP